MTLLVTRKVTRPIACRDRAEERQVRCENRCVNTRYAAMIVTVLCAGATFGQDCYTVRDTNGTVVYQAVKPPVDLSRPYQEEIATRFPGGYLEITSVFNRCGVFERQSPAPIADPAVTKGGPNSATNLFADLIPNAALGSTSASDPARPVFQATAGAPTVAPPASPPAAVQLEASVITKADNNSFGELAPKLVAAALIVGVLCAPRKWRLAVLTGVVGIVVVGIGLAIWDTAHPPALPFAQCIIDRVPAAQNDVAAVAIANLCASDNGGYDSTVAKQFVRGQARGYFSFQSRGDCVAAKASSTASEVAARAVLTACDCLYRSASENPLGYGSVATCG